MKKDCPQCKKEADLSPANIYRPFCSEKCKLIDFGSWTIFFHFLLKPK